MARPQKSGSRAKTAVKKAGSAIARTAKKITSKLHVGKRGKAEEPAVARAAVRDTPKVKTSRAGNGSSRPVKRQNDVPLDVLARTPTPRQTSGKESFRADGADRHRDQEFVRDRPDANWNDEDHYTNKSGDPRIGTHGRAYEPGEKR
jgi:hypothetical protein